jgi:hypothetical protein
MRIAWEGELSENTFWRNPDRWPTDPPEWIFLARAAVELADAMFEGWGATGFAEHFTLVHQLAMQEVSALKASRGVSGVSPDAQRALRAELDKHQERVSAVQEQLRTWAETAGQLRTASRPIRGGSVQPLSPVSWSTQALWARFYCCQINPANPFSNGIAGDAYQHVFVHRQDFGRLLSGIKGGSAQEPEKSAATSPIRWMLFSEAIDRLYTKYGSSADAANALRAKGLSGAIVTKADRIVKLADVDFMGRGGRLVEQKRDCLLDAGEWNAVEPFTSIESRWRTSSFSTTCWEGASHVAFHFTDIRFDAEAVERLESELPNAPLAITEQLQRGTLSQLHPHDGQVKRAKEPSDSEQSTATKEVCAKAVRATRLREMSAILGIPISELAPRPIGMNSNNNIQDEVYVHAAARMVRQKEANHIRAAISRLIADDSFTHPTTRSPNTGEKTSTDRIRKLSDDMYDCETGLRLK